VDLGGKKGGAPAAKRPIKSILERAVYAIDALASGAQANSHYMELHNKDARIQLRRPRVD
jgi:hypothetical protein